jgi:small-conductance mechanosensitive channel
MPNLPNPLSTSVWEAMLARAVLVIPQVAIGLLLLLAFWIISVIVERLLLRMSSFRIDPDLASLLAQIAKVSILVVGAMTALQTMGINVNALVAGLGLTGFALGFALKDIISNALAGILVMIYEPFKRGDAITVTGFEGAVEEINFRYTVLDMESKRAFIPNSNLFTNPVIVQKRGWTKPLSGTPAPKPPSPAEPKPQPRERDDEWHEPPPGGDSTA